MLLFSCVKTCISFAMFYYLYNMCVLRYGRYLHCRIQLRLSRRCICGGLGSAPALVLDNLTVRPDKLSVHV